MKIFNRKRKNITNEDQTTNTEKYQSGGDYGIHFPWVSVIFLIIGVASEITDALLLAEALGELVVGFPDWQRYLVAAITGSVCFFSMAAIGYQSANTKIKYSTKIIEIIIWLAVGIYIAGLRVFLAISSVDTFDELIANENTIMGFLQFLLYVGTGFMTYSATKQLTNAKLYEYMMAKREYNQLLDEIADRREYIINGTALLSLYPNYVKRLQQSKKSVLKNVEQYNKSVKSLCEAKMAMITEPDQMDNMYAKVKAREAEENI